MINVNIKVALLVTRLKMASDHMEGLLPDAIAWAQRLEDEVLATGDPLPESIFLMAKHVGVQHPERIRTKIYEEMPISPDPGIAREFGFWSATVDYKTIPWDWDALKPQAQTTGYGIAIAARVLRAWYGFSWREILCHEMVHVAQSERAGSLAEFFRLVAWNNIQYGYAGSPIEVEARKLGEAATLRWCEITGDAR